MGDVWNRIYFAVDLKRPATRNPLDKRIRIMKRSPSVQKAGISLAWHSLYQAALFETDRTKVSERIDVAERAILERVKELFLVSGDHIEEDQILDDALYALRALRNCVHSDAQAA